MTQPSLAAVLRGAFAEAPVSARRSAVSGLALWLLLMVVQGFDSANGHGPAAAAEFLSALCGSAGGILLALIGILNASAERTAGERRSGIEGERYRRVLLALPAIGLLSGMLLSAAVALMLVRGLLGAEVPLVVIGTTLFAVLLWLSAATVLQATRVLYLHAQLEAQDASVARVAAGEARLAALQARMNPHFLFNALNTVAALVRTDPRAAERVTENLSGVLRMTLERSSEKTSTVGAEERYLRAWLAVEQERWKDRLRIDWDIAPALADVPLPPLVLQPLVENALHHGIGARIAGGRVTVQCTKEGALLVLRVQDDGVGFPAAYKEGTGLGNLRQRLASVYGDAASLAVEKMERGAAVTVRLPFEVADARADRG